MEYKCDLIVDEIWERTRAGEDLSPGIREHIAACPDCECVVSEAQRIGPILQAAACVPDAPDCRSAVMDRISARPVWRTGWAYAIASVMLVAVLVGGLLVMRSGPKQSTQQMVREPRPEVKQEVVKPQPAPARKPGIRTVQPKPVIHEQKMVAQKSEVRRPKRIEVTPKHAPRLIVKQAPKSEPASQEKPQPPAPEVGSHEDEPVAAVAVTWPDADQPVMPASYSYTNRDTVTGELTTCRVHRSGDSIHLYYESKTPREKPGKGA